MTLKSNIRLALKYTLLILLLFLSGCGESEEGKAFMAARAAYNSPGQKAADFRMRLLDDEFAKLSDFEGEVTVLTFWRKKIKVSHDHLDSLQKLYEKFRESGLTVLAVNGDNLNYVPSSAIRKFVKEKGYTFNLAFDDEYAISEKYRVINIPVTYILDRQGIIVSVEDGLVDWMIRENLERVEKLL